MLRAKRNFSSVTPKIPKIGDISADIPVILCHLGWIDAPNTQNSEILKSLEKTQESNK
jgi:hypothetical protein